MKKLLSVVIALTMILSLVCVAREGVINGEDAELTMVVLGDSVASGYRLPDYDDTIARPRSQLSAAVLLSKEIGYDIIDFTQEGCTAIDILNNVLTESAENSAKIEAIKNADLITLSVGNMDIVKLFNRETPLLNDIMNGNIPDAEAAIELIEIMVGSLDDVTAEIAENLRLVFIRIRELNPTATIAFQNLYNSCEQLDVDVIKEATRILTLMLNAQTMKVCLEEDVVFVDVYSVLYAHRDEDLILLDCESLEDLTSGNFEADTHLTVLGHEYVRDAYLIALKLSDSLPRITGTDLKTVYKWSKYSVNKDYASTLPTEIVVNTTRGDFKVAVESWNISDKFNPLMPQNMTFIATPNLDMDTVPAFLESYIDSIGTCIKVGAGSFIKRGDANGDGVADSDDIALIREHMISGAPIIVDNADVTKDGKVNTIDLVFLTLMLYKK